MADFAMLGTGCRSSQHIPREFASTMLPNRQRSAPAGRGMAADKKMTPVSGETGVEEASGTIGEERDRSARGRLAAPKGGREAAPGVRGEESSPRRPASRYYAQ